MASYRLTCTRCGRKSDFFCAREKITAMNCGYCNTQTMEYHFKDNMTTGMIRSPINSLSGQEKIDRIERDMKETFKIKDISNKTNIKREEDFKVDWSSVGAD